MDDLPRAFRTALIGYSMLLSADLSTDRASERRDGDDQANSEGQKDFAVPKGYHAVGVVAAILKPGRGQTSGHIAINGQLSDVDSGPAVVVSQTNALTSQPRLEPTRDSLATALYLHNVWGFAISMLVIFEFTRDAYEGWQLETYERVMSAYLEWQRLYEEAVRAASVGAGAGIPGRSPLQNRAVEATELKKAAISILAGHRFESFGAVSSDHQGTYPEFDFAEAKEEGESIHFFEHAFEWPQASYVFYPYFWGRKQRWVHAGRVDDPDPQFAALLGAGAARFVVPVRPEYDQAMLNYLSTGQLWSGGPVPQIGDPFYVSIALELQEQSRPPEGTVVDEWPVRVPTGLVLLQKEGVLPRPPQPPEQ